MQLSDQAKTELREILIKKGISLNDLELEKCGYFLISLLANSLKIE